MEERRILIGLVQIKKLQNQTLKIGLSLEIFPKIPETLEESINIGLKNNPDYNQLKYEFENSKFDVRKSKLNFAPELSLSGSVGKALKSSRTIERKDSYEVTAEFSVPIFNKGHNFLNLEKSKIQQYQLLRLWNLKD